MQKIVKFMVHDVVAIEKQLEDYLTTNSTHTFISLIAVNNGGDEVVIALVDDGTQSIKEQF